MLDVNPVYDAPTSLRFGDALRRAGTSFHLGLYADETAQLSHWHLPQAHALESWSDARAHDGTISIVQPLMAPLYEGRSPHEELAIGSEEHTSELQSLMRNSYAAFLLKKKHTSYAVFSLH